MRNRVEKEEISDMPLARTIRKMVVDSAPEKKHELEIIWSQYAPVFRPSYDKPGFSFEAGPYGLLLFSYRTMLQIWLLGFAAWKTLYSYGALLLILKWNSQPFEPASISHLNGQADADLEFEHLIKKVRHLKEIENIEDFEWPNSIPSPENFELLGAKDEDKAIFDLVCMAATYLFLHEVQHIKFMKDGNSPEDPLDEELECHKFARNMLLDNVKAYSQISGDTLSKVVSKRAMAIALASFVILETTPVQLREGSRSHPAISSLFKQMTEYIELPAEDKFWNFLACLILSKLRMENRIPLKITFSKEKDLCIKLLGHLNQGV